MGFVRRALGTRAIRVSWAALSSVFSFASFSGNGRPIYHLSAWGYPGSSAQGSPGFTISLAAARAVVRPTRRFNSYKRGESRVSSSFQIQSVDGSGSRWAVEHVQASASALRIIGHETLYGSGSYNKNLRIRSRDAAGFFRRASVLWTRWHINGPQSTCNA